MSATNAPSVDPVGPTRVEWVARLRALLARARGATRAWAIAMVLAEWTVLLVVAYFFTAAALLNFDPGQLQLSGEHPEASTLSMLADIGLHRYGEIPLWNPYMLAGFPHQGDLVNIFWNPTATIPVLLFGGINGFKVSVFLSFLVAGFGQWVFGHVFGLRGWVRLWAALLFMLSGGIVLLWRLGWQMLMIGMVWFPAAFAALWWAMHRRDRLSVGLAGLTVAMILVASSAYYMVYFGGTALVLVGMAFLLARRGERRQVLFRAIAVGVVAGLLAAVALLPYIDGARYTRRDAPPDWNQEGSQPIHLALVNYVVSTPEWFGASMLGTKGNWNWFYIGWLPLLALAFTPLAYRDASRERRKLILTVFVLALFLFLWFGNKSSPIKIIYDFFPFLYQFRFPNRLLILATSPFLILAGYGLQTLLDGASRTLRVWAARFFPRSEDAPVLGGWLGAGLVLLVVFLTLRDVFTVNRAFAFFPNDRIDPVAVTALKWLKERDPGLFYIDVGQTSPEWKWTPVSYDLEMFNLNFQYNRRVATQDLQRRPDSLFQARAKYMFTRANQPAPPGGEFLRDFAGWKLYQMPDVLPYAFSTPAGRLSQPQKLGVSDVTPLEVRWDGPNRVVVQATASVPGQLVALVSDYPGWKLKVDGQPAAMAPANGYLGATMEPGEHTYVFVFDPPAHWVGLIVTLVSLLVVAVLSVLDLWAWRRRAPADAPAGPLDQDIAPRRGVAAVPDPVALAQVAALRRENQALRAELAALRGVPLTPEIPASVEPAETVDMAVTAPALGAAGALAEPDVALEETPEDSEPLVQMETLRRAAPWLALLVPLLLALIPVYFVVQDRWLRNPSVAQPFRNYWAGLPFASFITLPPYFVVIFAIFLILPLVMLLMRRRYDLPLAPKFTATPAAISRAVVGGGQVRVALVVVLVSLLGAAWSVGNLLLQKKQPGWDLALAIGGLLLGELLREVPLGRIGGWLWRNIVYVVAVLLFEAGLLVVMRGVAEGTFTPVSSAFVVIPLVALLLLAWRGQRPGPTFWLVNATLILGTLYINGWWFAAIGDEFSFYRYAREIVERQSLDFIGSKLFWGSAVYGTHPYLSSLAQAAVMKLLGTGGYGWRISSVIVSALAVGCFYQFFRLFATPRVALLTGAFIAASHYLMDFSRIGYNNTQALLVFGLGLWMAGWAVKSRRPVAFLALGLSLGLCFYVYPAALYVIPVVGLLVLFYSLPRSRAALANWAVMGLGGLLLVFPLFFQPEYWQAKVAGTMFYNQQLAQDQTRVLPHILSNFVYSLFAFVYIPEESHFVVMSLVDMITALLLLIGLAYLVSRLFRNRFITFFVLAYIMLVFLVGATHDRRFPPLTRLFLMLPWYAFAAAAGLTWVVEGLRRIRLGQRQATAVTAAIMLAVFALNIYHAYPFSYQQNGGRYQSLEAVFLRTAQRVYAPGAPPRVFAWINDPRSLHIPSLQEAVEMYRLAPPSQVQEIAITGPSLPPSAGAILNDPNTIIALSPRIDQNWKPPLETALREAGRQVCPIKNGVGDQRFDLWLWPDEQALCDQLARYEGF